MTSNRINISFLLGLLVALGLYAADAPKPVVLSDTEENSVLKAQKDVMQTQTQMLDLKSQYAQLTNSLQSQQTTLRTIMETIGNKHDCVIQENLSCTPRVKPEVHSALDSKSNQKTGDNQTKGK